MFTMTTKELFPSFLKGSWKVQLRQKFKNKRRGLNTGGEKGPEKRRREEETEDGCIDEETEDSDMVHKAKRRSSVRLPVEEKTRHIHEEQKKALQDELQKSKPSKQIVKKLMEDTSAGRILWIDQDSPMVEEILSEYPPLRNSKMVSFAINFVSILCSMHVLSHLAYIVSI